MGVRGREILTVEGRTVAVTKLDKVFYPGTGFTKGQTIDYYIRVAPVLLAHLRNRPITLKRYPEGVDGPFFYEKRCPSHRPQWVKTVPMTRRRENGHIDYCVANDLPALIWMANLANLELHSFLHCAPAMNRPTAVAFDLDPGPPAGIALCCQVALWLREIFGTHGLQSYAKTSGSKGLQVYLPVNTSVTYEKSKAFARALATRLERQHPDVIVSRMNKVARTGKVLVDWSQNDIHKTTVCVYSLRAGERPTVSTPLAWEEVEAGATGAVPLVFDFADAIRRIEERGDLFAPVLSLKQKLSMPWVPAASGRE